MIFFTFLTYLAFISFSLGFQNPLPQQHGYPCHAKHKFSTTTTRTTSSTRRAFPLVCAPNISQSYQVSLIHRHGLHESSSSSEKDGQIPSASSSDILSKIASHRTVSILYILTAIVCLATEGLGVGGKMMEGASASTAIKIQPGQYSATKVGGATGFAVAASVSYILQKYQQKQPNQEEGDDDYLDGSSCRKLNFGLLTFALIGLFAVPGEASLSNSYTGNIRTAILAFVIQYVSRAVGLIAAFRGWTLSNDMQFGKTGGGQKWGLLKEFKRGVVQTWKRDEVIDVATSSGKDNAATTRSGKKRKNSIYSTIFVCTLLGIMNNAMTFQHVTKTTAASLFHKSLYLSAIARLSLISTLASVLHDATSRKIMPLNVFKKFRLLLATWAISVGVARGVIDASLVSFILQKTVYFCIFAWPIMYKGSAGNQDNENGTDTVEGV